jgi:4-hydroxybenzoate polyprenyltransferase
MIKPLLRTMRPHQWAKNLLVFAPLLFSENLTDPQAVLLSTGAFALFCLLASSVYILNDVVDVDKDREHPHKRHRPIAAGELPVKVATKVWPGIVLFALVCAFFLSGGNLWFVFVCALYFGLNIAYSFKLKRIPYLDVMLIANGFLLRVLSGILILNLDISRWILPCTFLLALYMALGKRRHELSTHYERATKQREVLELYDLKQLDVLMALISSLTVLSYCGYTLDPLTLKKFGTPYLIYTTPFAVFGIVRFQQLMERGAHTESPTQETLRDIPSLLNALFYCGAVIYIIYTKPGKGILKLLLSS